MNEFVIKNGFISKGDSIVNGTISGDTLNLTTTPTLNLSATEILVRNSTTGIVERTTVGSIISGDTFVTGFTYDNSNKLTISLNDGSSFDATINQVSGLTVSGNLSATTIYSGSTDLSDIFLTTADGNDITRVSGGVNISTGGTANNPIVNLDDDISLSSVSATTLSGGTLYSGSTDLSDIFLTTADGNDITRVSGGVNISTGGTANNPIVNLDDDISLSSVSATTLSGGTLYSGSTDLTTIIESLDTYVTGGTFTASASTLTLDRQNDSVTITGLTSSDGTSNEIQITDNSGGFLASVIEQSGTHIIPTTDSVTNLGSATNRFDNLYLDTIVNVDGALNFYSNDAGTNLEFSIGTSIITVAGGNNFRIQNGYMYFTGINDRIGSTVASKIYLTNRQSSLRTGNLSEGYGFVIGNGIETAVTPDLSAIFKLESTTQGFLPPVMTGAEAEAISTPAEGLQVYASNAGSGDITSFGWWGYNGSNWVKGFSSGGTDTNTFVTGFTYNDNNIFTIFDNDGDSFSATINQVSGLTVDGILSATTWTGLTLNDLDDVTTNIPTTPDATYQGELLYFDTVTNQWVSGEEYGNLGDVTIWGKKGSAGTIDKGCPVYVVGFDSDLHEVELANATTGSTMPVIGFTAEDFDNAGVYPIVTFGKVTGVDTTSTVSTVNPNGETWAVNDVLFMNTTDGGLTKNRPSGSDTQIQRIAKILKVGTVDGQLFVFNTARTAGLPNLTTDYLWVGNGNDTPQELIKTDVGITTTGFTYNDNNTLTITDDNGGTLSTTINQMSGLTINGTLDATTILSGGTNLTTIIESLDTYVTGGTVSVSATDSDNSGEVRLDYKNFDGTPKNIPFEDTFVTGTTFSSNQATLTRNDGTDVLLLTGGTNVTLSNPSANQIKIDVSSSSSIDTGNVLWVDNIFGNNGTALVDRQDRPWSSIATALSNATTNDTIMVRPGEYVESPFTLVPSTSLVSQGGAKVTSISASTSTGNFITVSGSSYMEGFTIYTPTDDSAALYFNDSNPGIVTSVHNVHFKGSSTDSPPLGKGVVMDTGLASNGKIIYTELRYAGRNLDRLVEVNEGIFALDGMHVPGGGIVNKGIQANGGRLQLINVNIGNDNCNTAISVSGTASNTPVVVGFGLNLFNVPTGLEITSNYYDIELQNGRVEAGAENLLISSGLTGEFGKLNMVNFIMDSEKIDEPYTWADSEHTIFYSDIGNSQNVSPIIRTHGNLEIGQPNRGSSLSVGRGTEYQKGLHLHSSGSTGEVNLISSASTKGVVWSFGALAAGEELYIGSSERYPNGDYVNWCGFESTYTGSTGGTYTVEYYSGGTWVDIKYQVTNQEFGYNYSNNLFDRTVGTREDVRIGIGDANVSNWGELSLFGHTAKWLRVTMVTPPSSLPQFDLLWVEGSHTKINQNGIPTYYGSALYRDTIITAGNIFGVDGAVTDANIDVGSTVTWTHVMENSQFNTSAMMGTEIGDAIMLQTVLPKGTCTAYPLKISLHYILVGSGPLIDLPELTISVVVKETYNNKIADPTGGIVPTKRTLSNTNDLTTNGAEQTVELGELSDFSNEYLSVTDEYEYDISSLYESDGIFIRIEFEFEGDPVQTITIPAVEASVVKWALGERLNIEL